MNAEKSPGLICCPDAETSGEAAPERGEPLPLAESRYHAVIDALDEGFCIVEMIFDQSGRPEDYRFLEVNPAFERLTGIVGACGRRMRELAPRHEQYWFDIYGTVALTGKAARFERQAVAFNGRWYDVFAFRVDEPGQRHVGILFADITNRHDIEQSLRENEANLRRVIDHMSGFVGVLDRHGVLLEVGEPALRVAGLSREAVLGRRFWECGWWNRDPGGQARMREWVSQAALGITVREDVIVYTADGGHLDIDLMLVPVLDRSGAVTHIIASGIDISERKRIESALRENEARLSQVAAALQDADRRKDEFLATLAHELRNPLAPIRNGVHILRLISAGNHTLQRTTEMMDRQINHLVRLVDDLLDVSRITRGKIELRRERVILNDVLGTALESCETLFEPRGHELRVQISPEPLAVAGDADRLTQVFSNLLSNAAKFTPLGGTVWLSLDREGDEAVVRVSDTGIGIPPDHIKSVFEMFAQVHAPRSNEGLGISLSLVRQLISMHGGTVTAESEGEGRGSRFTVRLPLQAREGQAQSRRHPRETTDAAGLPRLGALTILVVDDNIDAAQSLAQLLELQGHHVKTCTSGTEAVEVALRSRPDVIFMDIGMPDMDGITAARHIRARPEGAAIRIFAVTGWGQRSDRERTGEAGFDAHLVKPVSADALESILDF